LLLLRNYTLASALRLKPSVLPVATRHFLTTSPNPASPVIQKTDKPKKDKPKRLFKKDLTPPHKRPSSSFVLFVSERLKQHKAASKTPVPFADTLREASVAWKKLSEDDKKPYVAPPEAFAAHRAAVKEWYAGLSDEAKQALRKRRQRKRGTGFSLYLTETYKQAKGNTLGERIKDRSEMWKAFPADKRENYKKRAAETLFGASARRAAARDRALERAAKAKIKAKEKAHKLVERRKLLAARQQKKKMEEKKKKEREVKKMREAKAKAKAQNVKVKKGADKKKVEAPKKRTTKATTKVKAKAKA